MIVQSILFSLAALSAQPVPLPAPATVTRIAAYEPDIADNLTVLSVESRDPRQPVFVAKRSFHPHAYIFFRDGRHQQVSVDAEHLIAYLPARAGADGYLVAARGSYHTEIVAYRFSKNFERAD